MNIVIVNGQEIKTRHGKCLCHIKDFTWTSECPLLHTNPTNPKQRCTTEELEACNDLYLTAIHDHIKDEHMIEWDVCTERPTLIITQDFKPNLRITHHTEWENIFEIVNDDNQTFELIDINDPHSFTKITNAIAKLTADQEDTPSQR